MGKYDRLRDYLAGQAGTDIAEMTFSEVEGFVGQLPSSARLHRSWWVNRADALAGGAAGWHVQSVQMASEQIVFARGMIGRRRPATSAGAASARTTSAGTTGRIEDAALAIEAATAGPHPPQADNSASIQASTGSLPPVPEQGPVPGHADPGTQSPVVQAPVAPLSSFQQYVSKLHFPLLAVLFVLCVVLGALGFGLRPGTDAPPAVPNSRIQLYVYQQKSLNGLEIEPSRVSVEEIMILKNPSTVEVQVNLLAPSPNAVEAPGI